MNDNTCICMQTCPATTGEADGKGDAILNPSERIQYASNDLIYSIDSVVWHQAAS